MESPIGAALFIGAYLLPFYRTDGYAALVVDGNWWAQKYIANASWLVWC